MVWGSIPLTSEFMAVYEFVSSPQQASQVGLSYIGKSPVLRLLKDSIPEINELTANGVRFQLSHRFYIIKSYDYAPHGFYLSPHISYATVKISTKQLNSIDQYIRVTHFSLSALAGWQWIYSNDLTFDIFCGVGYKDNFWEEHDSQKTLSLNTDDNGDWYNGPVKLTFGILAGIAF